MNSPLTSNISNSMEMTELSLFQPAAEDSKQSQEQQNPKTIWVENLIINPEAPENKRITYAGETLNGIPHGYGIKTYANGDKYVGEFKDGKYHGYGIKTYANGDKYVGEFKDDKYHGYGIKTYANGDKYVGEFKDDKKNGYGTYTFLNGIVLNEGSWINNVFNQTEEIPEEVALEIEKINKEIPEIDKLCLESQEKAKEAYLKVQSRIYRPTLNSAIPELPSALNDMVAAYAAPDYVGDGKEWNLEKVSFFSKISNFFSRKK